MNENNFSTPDIEPISDSGAWLVLVAIGVFGFLLGALLV